MQSIITHFSPTITTKSSKLQPHMFRINNIYKEVCSHVGVPQIVQVIDDSLAIRPHMQISNKNAFINWSYTDDTWRRKKYEYLLENIKNDNYEKISGMSGMFKDVSKLYLFKDHVNIQKTNTSVYSDILSIEADVWPEKLCYNFSIMRNKLQLDIIPPFDVIDFR